MQARRMARELALLGLSQLSEQTGKLVMQDFEKLLLAAIQTLTAEAKDALETASDELKRGNQYLVDSGTRASDVEKGRTMVEDAIALTQTAINRLAHAVELPEFIRLSNQSEIEAFALELLSNTAKHQHDVDTVLNEAMVAWNLKRLARIDRDILRLAVVEMNYLGTPDRVAINEAVELAKRYSDEDGYRFINGVLRRVVTRGEAAGVEHEGVEESGATMDGSVV
ncbi:transcription antitermination protein NusB [Nodosilinea sp. LEGE 06152]|uniref:transcription antitermination factor NusB n=1 Tax=Nodosilinea sp. LEGE 06152 TaxID=2777966 RepID=UPI00187EC255|nr:transcription antitermination factor NusB [Nodosilinea sp. LEGE 06152]MBE9156064.1 transcription antitermination protein NusB [Nodosilinea sp. LEGE 06152]